MAVMITLLLLHPLYEHIRVVKDQDRSMISPLFICPAYHVIKVHEEDVDEEWFTLSDKLRPDAECFGIYRFPFDR